MRVAGFWSGHDASFCVLDDGKPVIHTELERHIREKEPQGDSVELMHKYYHGPDPDLFVTIEPVQKLGNQHKRLQEKCRVIGHHKAHAAHAFYSSNIKRALIVILDGGGIEDCQVTATTVWTGEDKKIECKDIYDINHLNVGGLWTRVTRYIFRLQNGWPKGHQAGTVMAMAALGKTDKYVADFYKMLTTDLVSASSKPSTQPVGAYKGDDPVHPYLGKWTAIADSSEQEKYELARGLQIATEKVIQQLLAITLSQNPGYDSLCIAGGVALNSVAIGKIRDWFPEIKEVFVPPVPYDGGLCLGAAQYVTHHVMGVPRVKWDYCFPPYLGCSYTKNDVLNAIDKYSQNDNVVSFSDSDAIQALKDQKIISIFNGRAESGRRALGNRSIIADPRSKEMKDKVNTNVKHRQSFRPFAPSILRETISEIFENPQESPCMSHVSRFKKDWAIKVPAVVHFDGTARMQTVDAKMSPWWYQFISKWNDETGVPILLNTSFNDTAPIVESPEHAVDCFLGTEIDILYFPEYNLAIRKG